MRFRVVDGAFSVCRLDAGPDGDVAWVDAVVELVRDGAGSFAAFARRDDEVSLVCPFGSEPVGVRVEGPWRAIEVVGPLDFALVGVLASLAVPLADAGVSIFAVSTFDTDVVLVAERDVDRALSALAGAGHELVGDE